MPVEAAYPPPPWRLFGEGILVVSLGSARTAKAALPSRFDAVSVMPNRTPMGLYIAQYTTPLIETENAPWHEWGEVRAYARYQDHQGFWMERMAVDSEAALLGGIHTWGIQKSKAKIRFGPIGKKYEAALETEQQQAHLQWKPLLPAFPFHKSVSFLTQVNQTPFCFTVSIRGWFRFSRVLFTPHQQVANPWLQAGKYWGIHFQQAAVQISRPELPVTL